jgi:hypothetical protein
MKDTVLKRDFILFSCDGWSVGGTFSCGSALELSEHLASYHEFFGVPSSLSWRRVARRVFTGRPAFFTAGRGGYLLLPASAVSFYRAEPTRVVQTDVDTFTLYDHLMVLAEHPA